MTPLVYLMTVIHSLHAGNIEKAVKYSDKCLSHIDRVKTTRLEKPIFIGLLPKVIFSPLLQRMRMVALEHMIQSKIVIGEGTDALEMIERMSRAIRDNPPCYQTRHVRFPLAIILVFTFFF